MRDFTILNIVRPEDLEQSGVQTEAQFAEKFAADIAQSASAPVSGSYKEGFVHLQTENEHEQAIVNALDARRLSYGV